MAGCIGGLAGCLLLACASPALGQPVPATAPTSAGQPAPPAPPGAGPTAFRRFRFAARPLGGIPVGDFGDRVGKSPGVGVDFTSRIGRTPIAVGAELGYLQYGKETRRLSFVPAVPEVLTDVNTTNHLLQTHALLRVEPQAGRVRPYVEGLLEFRYVFTRASFTNPEEGSHAREGRRLKRTVSPLGLGRLFGPGVGLGRPGLGSTLLGDLAPSAGAGGGATVELVSGRGARLNLDLGLRYFTGGDVEYLIEGAIDRHEGGVALEPTRSAVDLISLHVGLAVDSWLA